MLLSLLIHGMRRLIEAHEKIINQWHVDQRVRESWGSVFLISLLIYKKHCTPSTDKEEER